MLKQKLAVYFIFGVLLQLCFFGQMNAQDYILEPGDKIAVSFWQQADLNTEVRIDLDGRIEIPVAGRITAAGLTVSQLGLAIVEKVSIYNRNITQALVNVIEYGSKKIYVTGAVQMPGPYTFEYMPNVWEAILQAGGPIESARLDQVTIVRGGTTNGQLISVDLKSYFNTSDLSRLPELRPGDNINVPGTTGGSGTGTNGANGGGSGTSTSSGLFSKRSVVYIYGQVVSPGVYEIEEGTDILEAIVRAGGPLLTVRTNANGPTVEPDLEHVRLITNSTEGTIVYEVDLDNYSMIGAPKPLILKAGDTIHIPYKESYKKFTITAALGAAITGSVSILVSYFLLQKVLKTN
ncbi:MAG: polysaccharide biosynthesis/export family protein [Deferribacteres bacterium]|nr:polysaccharide biosynthesis/export family protein [candidate division KSB1 bacterium]MCB9501792.1 polysaccharide biosynthesis/export family protein [Deferribacteres bacterium]